MSRTTWREQLAKAMRDRSDVGADGVFYAPDERAFDVPFDNDFGGTEGLHVLAWTERFVYFPVCYDGAEWIASAPRNPQALGQAHVGGG